MTSTSENDNNINREDRSIHIKRQKITHTILSEGSRCICEDYFHLEIAFCQYKYCFDGWNGILYTPFAAVFHSYDKLFSTDESRRWYTRSRCMRLPNRTNSNRTHITTSFDRREHFKDLLLLVSTLFYSVALRVEFKCVRELFLCDFSF